MIHALVFAATALATNSEDALRAWYLQANAARTSADFRIEYRKRTSTGSSEYGDERPIALGDAVASFRGLSPDALFSPGTHVHFTVPRDAGTIVCDGWAKDGKASGDFTIELSPAFARELERRGIGTPTAEQQENLVLEDGNYAILDTLHLAGYERPTVSQFTRLLEHGVSADYLRAMHAAGFSPLSIDEIVRARDHGVDPSYVRTLRGAGLKGSLDDFIRARDHGVDGDEAKSFSGLGLAGLSLGDLIRLRDHGVTASFAREMQSMGYRPSTDDLVRLRDHGVTAEYVHRLNDRGYTKLSVDDLVKLRDHGV